MKFSIPVIFTLISGVIYLSACTSGSSNDVAKSPQNQSAAQLPEKIESPSAPQIPPPNPGADVTKQFLKTYRGRFVESDFFDNFSIHSNGNVERMQVRNVGGQPGSQVPTKTACGYVKSGSIVRVEERSDSDRKSYFDFASHFMVVNFKDIQLSDDQEPSTVANPNCHKFLQETKAQIAAQGSLTQVYYLELLDLNSFRIQSNGGKDYQQGGPRTPETLDEMYVRISQ